MFGTTRLARPGPASSKRSHVKAYLSTAVAGGSEAVTHHAELVVHGALDTRGLLGRGGPLDEQIPIPVEGVHLRLRQAGRPTLSLDH